MIKGIGVLQSGNGVTTLTDKQIANADFVVLRERWSRLNPTKMTYDFKRLTTQVIRCTKAGKPWVLGVMTGADATPAWVEGKRLSWEWQDRRYVRVLAPWEKTLVSPYRKLIEKLWNSCSPAAVWVTGPTVASQEMHTNGVDKQKGFSSDLMLDNWNACFNAVRQYFNTTTKIVSISGQSGVRGYLNEFVRNCQALSTTSALAFQHNSLGPQTAPNAAHQLKIQALHDAGWWTGAELVQPGASTAEDKFPDAFDYQVWYPQDIDRRK